MYLYIYTVDETSLVYLLIIILLLYCNKMTYQDVTMVMCLPLLLLWLLIARVVSFFAPFLIVPSLMTASKFYWSIPFAKEVFRKEQTGSAAKGFCMRLGFEAVYCMNVLRRYLTLPLRRNLPDVYILGFPKCGTTALSQYLMQHPQIFGIDGLPYDETLSKESHFFMGILGKNTTGNKRLYSSFFPTFLYVWWKTRVYPRVAGNVHFLDACPLNACLPWVAQRIKNWTPDAKLIFMVRDPVESIFSGECMLRNAGLDLGWTVAEETETAKHQPPPSDGSSTYFDALEHLPEDQPLPDDLPHHVYYKYESAVYFSKFADRIQPFVDLFPSQNIMIIRLSDMKSDAVQGTVERALRFVGADVDTPGVWNFKEWRTWSGDRKGRVIDAKVREELDAYFVNDQQRLDATVERLEAERFEKNSLSSLTDAPIIAKTV
jgi:hypothetical protein